MVFEDAGQMVNQLWLDIPLRFKNIIIDKYQIMPNHLHGIIIIDNQWGDALCKRATTRVAPTILGEIIGAFKSLTTHEYINGVKQYKWRPFDKRLWQRNYYEHVIRNEAELFKIRNYIENNPLTWDKDENNPEIG